MSVAILEKYLPQDALLHLKQWFADYVIHIHITRGRHSKLGDYRPLPDGTHKITVNSTLPPCLFFFVLTHELAHLIAFKKYGRRILPHGPEWKATFRDMLMQSLDIYEPAIKPAIVQYARAPKANFMSSPDLVRYYESKSPETDEVFVETLVPGDCFSYRGKTFLLKEKLKINYLCQETGSRRNYTFKPLAKVQIIQHAGRQ